jgi:lipoprotein-anchoring transpeptidase ErfK/SrfK
VGVVLVICALFFLNAYLAQHVYPNTFFDTRNISGYSKDAALKFLARMEKVPVTVDIHDRIYTYTLDELGIIFDINKTIQKLFSYELLPFPQNVIAYVKARNTQRMIQPDLLFTQKFYERFISTVFDFSKKPDEISVNSDDIQLVFTSHEEKYKIEPKSLAVAISTHFGSGLPIRAKLLKLAIQTNPVTVNTYNNNLERITSGPVFVKIPVSDTPITIEQGDFKKLLRVNYDDSLQQLSIDVDETGLKQYVQAKLALVLNRNDLSVDMQDLKKNLVSLATSRFNAYDTSYVQASVVQTSQSRGDIAQKYIEIDIRQQTMYLWENGKNFATHRVSTGLYYPTPPGTYHILNKASNAYSDIYHVWMPYWMAFYLDPKINAYLGIHELPYWVTGDGTQIRRPRDFIGSPHTGGCVSLDVGEAQLVYNWAEVGMTVVIYE